MTIEAKRPEHGVRHGMRFPYRDIAQFNRKNCGPCIIPQKLTQPAIDSQDN